MSDDRASARRWIGASAALFLIAALLLPLAGPSRLDFARIWAHQDPDWSILLHLRVSRVLLGLFAGAALSLAGALFQAMLRDALATPYTLGISGGASLGAVVAISAGGDIIAGIPGVWAGAAAGAAAVLVLVMTAARRERRMSSFGLLLAGVATNSVCSAVILLIHSTSGVSESLAISRWLIGSLDAIGYTVLAGLVATIAVGSWAILAHARSWNALAVGEAWAATRGTDVQRLMNVGYVSGSLLVAATVAFTGPIGFIGLVVPHLVRTRISGDHRILMPCSFLLGGVLLASCDALARTALAPAEVPAGAVTAFIGGPYLVWLVRRAL